MRTPRHRVAECFQGAKLERDAGYEPKFERAYKEGGTCVKIGQTALSPAPSSKRYGGGQFGSGLTKTYQELLNEAQVFYFSKEAADKSPQTVWELSKRHI